MEVPNKGQPIKISKKLPNGSKRWLRSGWQQDHARPFTAKLPNNREASEDKTADLW
jgi:hypothetical protein